MQTWKLLKIVVLTFVTMSLFNNDLDATMFCNMDNAGGEEGKEVQDKTSKASAMFFQAASTTFLMFREIELYYVGEKDALERASSLSIQSQKQLNSASKLFSSVLEETDALNNIDVALKRLNPGDYKVALSTAKVSPTSPFVGPILEAFQSEGSRGVLKLCGYSIKDLENTTTPMGKVYKDVEKLEVPSNEILWSANVQFSQTLIKGQLISSVFSLTK